jgi:hypothetical protein
MPGKRDISLSIVRDALLKSGKRVVVHSLEIDPAQVDEAIASRLATKGKFMTDKTKLPAGTPTTSEHDLYLRHLESIFKRDAELREQAIVIQRKLNDIEIEHIVSRHEQILDQRPWDCAKLPLARRVDIVLGIYNLMLVELQLPPDCIVPDVYANGNFVGISIGAKHYWRDAGEWKVHPLWGENNQYKNALDWAKNARGIKLEEPEAICAWLGCCKALNLDPATGEPK